MSRFWLEVFRQSGCHSNPASGFPYFDRHRVTGVLSFPWQRPQTGSHVAGEGSVQQQQQCLMTMCSKLSTECSRRNARCNENSIFSITTYMGGFQPPPSPWKGAVVVWENGRENQRHWPYLDSSWPRTWQFSGRSLQQARWGTLQTEMGYR